MQKKFILGGSLIGIFIIGIVVGAFVVLNVKKDDNDLKEIKGKIIVVDPDYLILESDGNDYLISNMSGNYDVLDEVQFTYLSKDMEDDGDLKILKIKEEKIIKKAYEDLKSDSNENDTFLKEPDIKDSNIKNEFDKKMENEGMNTSVSEEAVLNYVREVNNDFQEATLKESVKKGFITVVDFIFYEGKIKGYSFKDLSNKAKLEVISMALYLDTKIDKYFPSYKESISTASKNIYTDVKGKIIKLYLNIATSLCADNNDMCDSAKRGFLDLKKNVGISWELIKEIAGDGISSLSSWYKIWSGK